MIASARHPAADGGDRRHREENLALEIRVDSLAAAPDEAMDRAVRAETAAEESRLRAERAESRVRTLERAATAFREIDAFPQTVAEVIDLAEKVFGDRLRFTDRARRSADDATLNESPSDMSTVWSCLRAMATTLHELHFPTDGNANGGTIIQRFEAQTRFGLALSESSGTRGDANLMRLRRTTYDGREIDISSHVKWDSGRRFLRVHYCPIVEERILVVDHCGDHLDTAGTRRRR